jgi:hypothetical protein
VQARAASHAITHLAGGLLSGPTQRTLLSHAVLHMAGEHSAANPESVHTMGSHLKPTAHCIAQVKCDEPSSSQDQSYQCEQRHAMKAMADRLWCSTARQVEFGSLLAYIRKQTALVIHTCTILMALQALCIQPLIGSKGTTQYGHNKTCVTVHPQRHDNTTHRGQQKGMKCCCCHPAQWSSIQVLPQLWQCTTYIFYSRKAMSAERSGP